MAHLCTSSFVARAGRPRGSRGGVIAFRAERFVLGASYVGDFRPGPDGDVVSLRRLYAELAPAGCDGRHPFLDRRRLARDGARVVQVGTGVLGGHSWLRLRESGPDLVVEADTGARPAGTLYRPVLVLRGVSLAQIVPQNFDPPLRLGGALVRADEPGQHDQAAAAIGRRRRPGPRPSGLVGLPGVGTGNKKRHVRIIKFLLMPESPGNAGHAHVLRFQPSRNAGRRRRWRRALRL
jgi:hypothetical protein